MLGSCFMLVQLAFENDTVRFGNAGPLVIASYKGALTLTALKELEKLEDGLLKVHPRIASLAVMGKMGGMFQVDKEVQKYGVELATKYEKVAHGSAIVVQTKGLGAVVVRTFLSAYFMMSKSTMVTQTFASVDEGLAWLQQLPGQNPLSGLSVSAADIEAFVR